MASRIITVFGATGAQGGSVVDYLLASGEFKVRGVTRDLKSAAAEALTKKGVEVVVGNLLEPETLKKSVAGSYGVFAVTQFWEQRGKETEIVKNLIDIAKEAKITHFIWSTLPNLDVESKGKYTFSGWSDKARADDYVKKACFKYHTFVAAPLYYQNWGTFYKPKKEKDGSLVFTFPHATRDTRLAQGDIREIGIVVTHAFQNPEGWGYGDYIAQVGEEKPLGEFLDALSEHLGVPIHLNTLSAEAYMSLFPDTKVATGFMDYVSDAYVASVNVTAFGYFRDFGYYPSSYDIRSGHKAKGSALRSFREWLKDVNFKFA